MVFSAFPGNASEQDKRLVVAGDILSFTIQNTRVANWGDFGAAFGAVGVAVPAGNNAAKAAALWQRVRRVPARAFLAFTPADAVAYAAACPDSREGLWADITAPQMVSVGEYIDEIATAGPDAKPATVRAIAHVAGIDGWADRPLHEVASALREFVRSLGAAQPQPPQQQQQAQQQQQQGGLAAQIGQLVNRMSDTAREAAQRTAERAIASRAQIISKTTLIALREEHRQYAAGLDDQGLRAELQSLQLIEQRLRAPTSAAGAESWLERTQRVAQQNDLKRTRDIASNKSRVVVARMSEASARHQLALDAAGDAAAQARAAAPNGSSHRAVEDAVLAVTGATVHYAEYMLSLLVPRARQRKLALQTQLMAQLGSIKLSAVTTACNKLAAMLAAEVAAGEKAKDDAALRFVRDGPNAVSPYLQHAICCCGAVRKFPLYNCQVLGGQ